MRQVVKAVVFQIDHIHTLNEATDTSLLFMRSCLRRGYDVFYYYPEHLSYHGGEIRTNAYKFNNGSINAQITTEQITITLNSVDVIFIRQNPPFDINYITATYLLEALQKPQNGGVRVINDPKSIRDCPEKMFVLDFKHFMPETIITPHYEEAREFHDKHKEIIIKPLHSYGGIGIFYIPKDDKNLFSAFNIVKSAHDNLPVICQQYIPEVQNIGDKRILLVNGKYFKALNRIQAPNMSVSNTRNGGKALTCGITHEEELIIAELSPKLVERGLIFVGIDVIGGKYLTEINVTSPTGMALMNTIYNETLEDKALDAILGD